MIDLNQLIADISNQEKSCSYVEQVFRKWLGESPPSIHEARILLKGFIQQSDRDWDFNINGYMNREKICHEFSFAIPCKEAIDKIKHYANGQRIVEIGAGSGYWANFFDGLVYATDVIPEQSTSSFGQQIGKYYQVHNYNHTDAVKLADHVFMCWPPMSTWTVEVVENIKQNNILFLIAEGCGGCCGTEEMFEYIRKEFKQIDECQIPQWYGIHDYLQIYKRK